MEHYLKILLALTALGLGLIIVLALRSSDKETTTLRKEHFTNTEPIPQQTHPERSKQTPPVEEQRTRADPAPKPKEDKSPQQKRSPSDILFWKDIRPRDQNILQTVYIASQYESRYQFPFDERRVFISNADLQELKRRFSKFDAQTDPTFAKVDKIRETYFLKLHTAIDHKKPIPIDLVGKWKVIRGETLEELREKLPSTFNGIRQRELDNKGYVHYLIRQDGLSEVQKAVKLRESALHQRKQNCKTLLPLFWR